MIHHDQKTTRQRRDAIFADEKVRHRAFHRKLRIYGAIMGSDEAREHLDDEYLEIFRITSRAIARLNTTEETR